MRIALLNLEPKIFNIAYMQISQFHKEKNDSVEWYSLENHDSYDKIYCSSIFTFTQKPSWLFTDPRVSFGGTGFEESISKKLPKEIESCNYDWSLYPECDYSIVWFSRGCIRNCPFCFVREKEGSIHSVTPKNLNPNGNHIKVYDNNFFANPDWREAIKQLQLWNQKVDFNQGLDIRLMDQEKIAYLLSLKHWQQYKFAWDLPKEDLHSKFEWIINYIKPSRIIVYVLVGFNSTLSEDLMRVDFLHNLGLDPFVMIYNNRKDIPILRHLARWCNRPQLRNTCTFVEYLSSKKYSFENYSTQQSLSDFLGVKT